MGAVENQRQVYHRSHRPWKSLQDFHTPAAQRPLIHKTKRNRSECHRLIAVLFVSIKGCTADQSVTAFVVTKDENKGRGIEPLTAAGKIVKEGTLVAVRSVLRSWAGNLRQEFRDRSLPWSAPIPRYVHHGVISEAI